MTLTSNTLNMTSRVDHVCQSGKNGFHYDFDFEHTDASIGNVVVSALFWFSTAEDLETYTLDQYLVYQFGQRIYIDIPSDVIYNALFEQLREISINETMVSNRGF